MVGIALLCHRGEAMERMQANKGNSLAAAGAPNPKESVAALLLVATPVVQRDVGSRKGSDVEQGTGQFFSDAC